MSEPERALNNCIKAEEIAGELGCDPDVARAAAEILKQRVLPSELTGACQNREPWLWHGYLGPGKMTLLTSQWKSGKTTLVSILLKRMETGGELAGLAVAAGRAAVFTEEGKPDWKLRHQKLHLANSLVNAQMAELFFDFGMPMIVAANNPYEQVSVKKIEGTMTVSVADGRLTISNASGSKNNKIDFVEITPL